MSSSETFTPSINAIAKRPLGLATVLIVLTLATIFGTIYGVTHRSELFAQYPRFTPGLWNIYLFCAFAGIAAKVAMWFWRRWGFWLNCVVVVFLFGIELYAMGPGLHLVRIVIAFGLILYFVRPVWSRFR